MFTLHINWPLILTGAGVLLLGVSGLAALCLYGPGLVKRFRTGSQTPPIRVSDRREINDYLFACEEFFRTKLPNQEALDHLTATRQIFTRLTQEGVKPGKGVDDGQAA